MNGAIPPLPNTPSWRGAQLKNTGTILSYLYLSCFKNPSAPHIYIHVCECVCMYSGYLYMCL